MRIAGLLLVVSLCAACGAGSDETNSGSSDRSGQEKAETTSSTSATTAPSSTIDSTSATTAPSSTTTVPPTITTTPPQDEVPEPALAAQFSYFAGGDLVDPCGLEYGLFDVPEFAPFPFLGPEQSYWGPDPEIPVGYSASWCVIGFNPDIPISVFVTRPDGVIDEYSITSSTAFDGCTYLCALVGSFVVPNPTGQSLSLLAPAFPPTATLFGRPIGYAVGVTVFFGFVALVLVASFVLWPDRLNWFARKVSDRLPGRAGGRVAAALEAFITGLDLLSCATNNLR